MTTPDNNQTDGLDVIEAQRLLERERGKRMLADAESPLFAPAQNNRLQLIDGEIGLEL